MADRLFTTAIGLLVLAATATGCASATNPTTVQLTATETPEPSPTVPDDMMMRSPDVSFECGEISALSGIAYRSQWEYDHGLIDTAAFDSRQAALADAWNYMLTGQTQVTRGVVQVQGAVSDAASLSTPEAQAAIGALTAACEEAGSLVGIGALPEMGG